MVFLPKSILKNVLSFCDDRIEQNQKILKKDVISTINILNQLRNLHSLNVNICDMYDGYFQLNPPVEGFYKIDSLIFDSIDPTTSDLDSYITKMATVCLLPYFVLIFLIASFSWV